MARRRAWARRVGRWTLNAATVGSAVLCVAAGVLWARSYWMTDHVMLRSPDPAQWTLTAYAATASHGSFFVRRTQSWGLDEPLWRAVHGGWTHSTEPALPGRAERAFGITSS
ncbi:MAG: hypothetical protein ACAI43_11930 [Phycisphaerae bacterium]|nr:hypothetical protein [Tepidisphaeraceae bacterium]